MANYKSNEVSYNPLHDETAASSVNDADVDVDGGRVHVRVQDNDNEQDDATDVIIHSVPENNRGGWTHIEDLDTFFTRMYRYYLKGGFCAMLVSDALQLLQYVFIIFFLSFLVHCVNYPVLFRHRSILNTKNVTFPDIVYPNCANRVSFNWWMLIGLCSIVGLVRLAKSVYHLFHAYDIKLFYNNGLKIQDEDLSWLSWCSVQSKVRDAQQELQMCIHKQQITELDIYHRILRFDNYLVAMVNKKLLPLHVSIPCFGDIPYLSKGLKYNLQLLLFYNPWSPWENCWHLRDCFKDPNKRFVLAKQLKSNIVVLTFMNLLFSPLILAWQILYFSFSYAELIKRSPESLGLRTWSLYARILLRHFNELDHELSDRLNRAHKPATKYLTSLPSPVVTIIAKNTAFLCASILGVIIILSLYDEVVLSVDNMLSLITALGCVLAIARSFIPDESIKQRSSEELLVQVLGHVHYLPASWKGRAHTKDVAMNFQQMFQFRAMYILIELLSPLVCPLILFSLRSRALDIVDFYRNFTVSVLDIGDVCSFAQMDVGRHGNPEWPAGKGPDEKPDISQCNRGEDGKTELSLVAFSCRNPGWKGTNPSQQEYLQTLHHSIAHANQPFAYQNNFSNYQRNTLHSIGAMSPRILASERFGDIDENRDERDADDASDLRRRAIADRIESLQQEEQDLSISTLHLYDLHLNTLSRRPRRSATPGQEAPNTSEGGSQRRSTMRTVSHSNEDTPLLKKTHP